MPRPVLILSLYEYLLNRFNYPIRVWGINSTILLPTNYITSARHVHPTIVGFVGQSNYLLDSQKRRRNFYGTDDPKTGESQPLGSTFNRSHLSDAETWSCKKSIVASQWAGDHPRIAMSIDDSGRASVASGIGMHETTVTHWYSRKRIAADRGSDGERYSRNVRRFKLNDENLTGTNPRPTIVGLVKTQPFSYLGVIISTTTLNLSWAPVHLRTRLE